MDKVKGLIIGFFIGILTTTIGTYFFITRIIKNDFLEGLNAIKTQGYLGKIITLGAVLNVIAFFILLRYNKEMMARGVILATIMLTIFTLFL